MNIKELRIGNYIESEFDGIEEVYIKLLERVSDEFETIYPIPLTEDWLLKFGFKEISPQYFTVNLMDYDYLNIDLDTGDVKHDSHWITNVKYVHQLQNLYFALTGEELNFKSES